jgi:5-methylthioadenosine/S-adenosylhomocysteine deaminase
MLSNNALKLFQEMKFAVLLQRAPQLDGHALSAGDQLPMGTLEGAQALGWQDEIGCLEGGKEADLVVLDIDHPLGLSPERVLSDLVFAAVALSACVGFLLFGIVSGLGWLLLRRWHASAVQEN